jgi:hypothetical protein
MTVPYGNGGGEKGINVQGLASSFRKRLPDIIVLVGSVYYRKVNAPGSEGPRLEA